LTPQTAIDTKLATTAGTVFIGFFPGFVWGWYKVSTFSGWDGFANLAVVYGLPYAAGCVTPLMYLALRLVWARQERLFISIFAAAAIIIYYWFRLPPVFGMGAPASAMIVDISPWLPAWSAVALRLWSGVGITFLLTMTF
jgi:hypothetical protein